MVDVMDSKSIGLILRAGSSPASGTKSSPWTAFFVPSAGSLWLMRVTAHLDPAALDGAHTSPTISTSTILAPIPSMLPSVVSPYESRLRHQQIGNLQPQVAFLVICTALCLHKAVHIDKEQVRSTQVCQPVGAQPLGEGGTDFASSTSKILYRQTPIVLCLGARCGTMGV